LLIFEGRYTEPLILRNLQEVAVAAVPGQRVVVDGSDPLGSLNWNRLKGKIFRARLDEPVWQLFCNDKMMTAARWPNAHMTDDNFFNLKDNWRMSVHGDESPYGVINDVHPVPSGGKSVLAQTLGTNQQTLAETGIDMTGAVAILNIGSWMTYTSRITEHNAGSGMFRYDKGFLEGGKAGTEATRLAPGGKFERVYKSKWHSHYYMIEGLQCLDVEREYWYNHKDKHLYFISPDGKSPNAHALRGKRRDYMLTMKNCLKVSVHGVKFFAGAFQMDNCIASIIQDSDFLYPQYNKFQIGDFDFVPTSTIRAPENVPGDRPVNAIINCRFRHFDGEALHASRTLIENSLFHDFNYSCLGFGVALRPGENSVLRKCTVYRAGASEGFRGSIGSNIFEYCRIYDYGGLQFDGSSLQSGGRGINIYYRNWSHDHPKNGFRFDAGDNPELPNAFGQVIQNVAWNVDRGTQIKGDDHLIANNLLMDTELELNTNMERWKSTNYRTICYNNLAGGVNERGVKKSNFFGDEWKSWLRDPQNMDFRPRKDSPLAGEGTPVGFPPEWIDFSRLSSPISIGPYEADSDFYWIPGYQSREASTPIPPNGTKTAKSDCDLIWLGGYKADSHAIYFGDNEEDVSSAEAGSVLHKGTYDEDRNIFSPGSLVPGRTYFWRVDAIRKGEIARGKVWRFTVGD
jgi:hypothetical protein